MLRCIKLWTALDDIKKILEIILKSEDMYYANDGILKYVIDKYESQPGLSLSSSDETLVVKLLQFFKRLSRRITVF